MTKIIAVVNLKGGTGKTTTTAHLAHAYRKLGLNVLVVDADTQQSTADWSVKGSWEIPVISKVAPKLHMLLPGIIGTRFDVVLIDTPGRSDGTAADESEAERQRAAAVKGIVWGAIRAADFVLVPVAPTALEAPKVPATFDLIEEAAALRDEPLPWAVLFNRTTYNASSTKVWEQKITKQGGKVLTTKIGRREAIAQGAFFEVTDLYDHDQVIIEMDRIEASMKVGK